MLESIPAGEIPARESGEDGGVRKSLDFLLDRAERQDDRSLFSDNGGNDGHLSLDIDDLDDPADGYTHLNGSNDRRLPKDQLIFEEFSSTEQIWMYGSVVLILANAVGGSIALSLL